MRKKQLLILTVGMILYLVIFAYSTAQYTQPSLGRSINIDSYVTADVYRSDGTTDHCDFSKLSNVTVCDARNSLRCLVGDKIPSYMLSGALTIMFSIIFLAIMFWKQGGAIRFQGMYLSAFCVGMLTWQMGYERMFYIWSDNVQICGMALLPPVKSRPHTHRYYGSCDTFRIYTRKVKRG